MAIFFLGDILLDSVDIFVGRTFRGVVELSRSRMPSEEAERKTRAKSAGNGLEKLNNDVREKRARSKMGMLQASTLEAPR